MSVWNKCLRSQIGSARSQAACGLSILFVVIAVLSLLPATPQQPALRLEQARHRRVDPARFETKLETGDYTLAASFTGRSMISPDRSALVRNHLVVEVLLVPLKRSERRIDLAAFGLKVNDESHPRSPQTPSVAAYSVRNPELREGPRLTAAGSAGGGTVIWDSEGRPARPRFPGDPRVPAPRPSQDREAARVPDGAELDAEAVTANAFPEGVVLDPTAGYLYFPADIELQRIRKLELVFRPAPTSSPNADAPMWILRLK